MSSLGDAVRRRNDEIHAADRWRTVRTLGGGAPRTTLADGTPVVHFASNDYLGLSQHPDVIAAAVAATRAEGTGAGASRLVVGGRHVHEELEAELAAWTGHEAALVFPTGFAANLGVMGALVGAGGRGDTTVFSDELNHASIIDGIRAARATVDVYPHLSTPVDPDALGRLAERLASRTTPHAVVVTDLVFSMDGDVAPVRELAELCAEHDAVLVLDEAHAALGPHDAAVTARAAGCEVVTVGTLSKTLGSVGGFVAGSRDVVDLCVNTARSFIFTTAPPPSTSAAALAALRIVRGPEGDERRARLRAHVERIRPGHPSAVVPVVLGSEEAALAASQALLEHGLLVPAIRPPTVPAGTSRLRVALSAAHDDADVELLATELERLGRSAGPDTPGSVMPFRGISPGIASQNAEGAVAEGPAAEGATRPGKVVVVAGTATEVGKTWVGAAVARELRDRGTTVAARKPAQSFEPADVEPGGIGTDADALAAATGEDAAAVCPPHRRYPVPMAPPMAADALGEPRITVAELAAEVASSWPAAGVDIGLVELAGGTRSPAAHDGDGVDLARAVRPDVVVLVADAGLGTVHAVRSALDGLGELRSRTVVHLNRYDGDGSGEVADLHRRNRDVLVADGGAVTTSIAELADHVATA